MFIRPNLCQKKSKIDRNESWTNNTWFVFASQERMCERQGYRIFRL